MDGRDYFKDVVFLVEADSFAQHQLWLAHAVEAKEFWPGRDEQRVDWQQKTRGHSLTIGTFGGMPVCIAVSYAVIQGKLVCFYYAHSMVAHYDMVQKFLQRHFKGRWDNGRRWAHCDAMNFHHCLDAIRNG